MKSVISAIAFAAVVQANPAEHDAIRSAMIDEINNTPGITWTAAAHPRFAGQATDTKKDFYGVKEGSLASVKNNTKLVTSDMWGEMAQAIPDDFDAVTGFPACAKIIGEIRDQSNCGCCWAFGGAEAASDRLCIATGGKISVPLSAQETCFCASSDGCDGGFVDTPWDYLSRTGLTTGDQYDTSSPGNQGDGWCSKFSLPHCHHHGPQGSDPYPAEGQPGCPSASSPSCPTSCDSTAKAPHNDFKTDRYTFKGTTANYGDEQSIQQAIMGQGPVEAAFTVYADFENYASGVYQHTTGGVLGGHAIRITGWGVDAGVKYWKVANSWNPYWGEKGYFRIIRGQDECGIESQVVANDASATWGKM